MANANQTMARDTIIYIIAKVIEGILGVLTISVMSHIYLPQEMGKYSTINTAITTIAMVLIQWLVQSVLRYVSKYEIESKLDKFYSTIFFSWVKINFCVLILAIISVIFFNSGFFTGFSENYSTTLILLGVTMFFTYNTYQLITALVAGARKSKLNLFLSILNVVGKLLLLITLNYFFSYGIELIFISYIFLDLCTSLIGIYKLGIIKYISLKNFDEEILKTFKIYGYPLMGNMIATSVLNKSDIYIITAFLGEESTGIYQTNYSIVASAFTLLAIGVMRGSYPTILKTWNSGDQSTSKKLLGTATRNYLLISVPAVAGVFVLSDAISQSLFESLYHEGHIIMGFVALGMMFLGLTEYAIKPWELNSITKEIVKRSFFCGMINVILNVVFIKYFGYIFAGISTFIAFSIYFILAIIGTRNIMKFNLNLKSLVNILISALCMSISLYFTKSYFEVNIVTLAILVTFGAFIYFTVLYFTGEIKNEFEFLKNKIRRK